MGGFKTTLITCQQCGRRIMVRPLDLEKGSITCSHIGCGAINLLHAAFQYDEAIVQGLPGFGLLTYEGSPTSSYPLQFGSNVIGTSSSCTVQVNRYMHNNRCYISRRHCTLTVAFDKWTGQLRYQLQDGAVDAATKISQHSLNGTSLNGILLQKTELVDVADGKLITLGSIDQFQLTHYPIPPTMLDTYKVELGFNPDRTQ